MLDRYSNWTIDEVTDTGDLVMSGTSDDHGKASMSLRIGLIREVAYIKEGEEIWHIADGMGSVHPAEHEYDWSSIRDSSDHAKQQMYAYALTLLPRAEFCMRAGITDRAPTSDDSYLGLRMLERDTGEPFIVKMN
jgi:hypothetical protein